MYIAIFFSTFFFKSNTILLVYIRRVLKRYMYKFTCMPLCQRLIHSILIKRVKFYQIRRQHSISSCAEKLGVF